MAHRLLSDPVSKCAVPHGHNETVTVRLASDQRLDLGGRNLVAPFEQLKRRWGEWIDDQVDHAFQISAADPLLAYFQAHEPARLPRLMVFQGDPTTEALALAFAMKLGAFLKADDLPFRCESVAVEETPTNRVVLDRAWDLADYGDWGAGAWPRRPDASINDLAAS